MKVEITRWKTNTKEGKGRQGRVKKLDVRIDNEDTWSADWTIAQIAHPLLKQLKETKQGAPLVDDEDVPLELRSTSCSPKENEWDIDENHFKRWDYVLGEMIFAMQEIANNKENEPPFYTEVGEMVWGEIDPDTGVGELKFEGFESTPESEAAYKAYHERIQRGCELFGKYFMAIWS